MRRLAVVLALLSLVACATGYHSTGFTGGFEETQLGPTMFQVRFSANAYTNVNTVSQFLMRRCAELTLENGFRFFELNNIDRMAQSSSAGMAVVSFPSGTAIIHLVAKGEDNSKALDAIFVMDSTATVAKAEMTPRAAESYKRFKSAT